MIKVEHMHPREHIFTWQNPETEEELNFATTRLARWATHSDNPVYETPVEMLYALMFIRDRGIETHRLERLNAKALKQPLLYCKMDGGTDLLVDGHHRYVYAAITGELWLPAYMVQPEDWKRFLITGIPTYGRDAITRGFSGIL